MKLLPREKLELRWAANLRSAELVAVILGSGVKWVDVFELSKIVACRIEEKKEHITVDDLTSIHGIWKTKAQAIISAFELAKRYYVVEEWNIISSSEDILEYVSQYRNKKQEYLLCATLDGANRLMNLRVITIGLLNQSLVHPREVFCDAIADCANSIVLVHNHPSNSLEPSQADIDVTKRLQKVADIVWIEILDHIIITKTSHFSFAKNFLL